MRRIRLGLLTLALAVALTSQSRAQEKSESTAFALSLVATVAPTVIGYRLASSQHGRVSPFLLLYGVYFGPATGYVYAGEGGKGLAGVGLRAGIAAATVAVATAACGSSGWSCDNEGLVSVALLAGVAGIIASDVHDIAGVRAHVRRANARRAATGRVNANISPIVNPFSRSGGLSVQISF